MAVALLSRLTAAAAVVVLTVAVAIPPPPPPTDGYGDLIDVGGDRVRAGREGGGDGRGSQGGPLLSSFPDKDWQPLLTPVTSVTPPAKQAPVLVAPRSKSEEKTSRQQTAVVVADDEKSSQPSSTSQSSSVERHTATVDDPPDRPERQVLVMGSTKTNDENLIVTNDNKVLASTLSTARLVVRLESHEYFCFHENFDYGDSVDVYYNLAPTTYTRDLEFEFSVLQNFPQKDRNRKRPLEPHAVVAYKDAIKRHGSFTLTVTRTANFSQDVAPNGVEKPNEFPGDNANDDSDDGVDESIREQWTKFDFCFDTSGTPSATTATLVLTRTSRDEYRVLEDLVEKQFAALLDAAGDGGPTEAAAVRQSPDGDMSDPTGANRSTGGEIDANVRKQLARNTARLVKEKLRFCATLLQQMNDVERAGRRQAEENFQLVNCWSAIQVVAMLASSLIQILTIKSLFVDNSRTQRFFKAIFGGGNRLP